MRRVIWSGEAIDNLDRIIAYIEQFNPLAAQRLGQRLRNAADALENISERVRIVAPGIRQLAAVRPYLIRYRIDGDTVYILRVRHGARLQD